MAFLGMRGTGDWATNERPENWRQAILYLYPNGDAPLTGMLSMLGSEGATDPKFHWWTKTLASQGGAVTNVFDDPLLSTAYTSGGVTGTVVYAQVALAVAQEFRVGHQAKLGKTGDYRYNTVGKVVAVSHNGASSYVAVRLNEDATAATDLDEVDEIYIVGNQNPEGGTMPDAVAYNPVQHTNVTQIFRTPLSITRTARKTRLRTADAYKEAKREALEISSVEQEKALLWSTFYEGTGDNGKPERTMRGLIPAIIENEPNNVADFKNSTDSAYSGFTWLQAGEVFLDTMLEQIFRYGSTEKMAFVGSGALLGINRLVKALGNYEYKDTTTSYGIKVKEWVTPFGTLFMKTHPLFSYQASNRNDMVIFEPSKLRLRVIDEIDFIPDTGGTSNNSKDSTDEEWLGEYGLEYHHTPAFGYLAGVGIDNVN